MPGKITLYHCASARSFRVLWALEELGLPYSLELLPFPPRVHARDYLQINPLGTIPYFVDGDTRMTESCAICHYLAVRYGPTSLAVQSDEPAFGAYLNWLVFGEATLTFPQTIVLRYSQLEPPDRRLPAAAEDYARWFLARLRAVEAATQRGAYLCADRFTMADISVGYALMLSRYTGLEAYLPGSVAAYWGRLAARDAYRRALDVETRAAERTGLRGVQPAPTYELPPRNSG